MTHVAISLLDREVAATFFDIVDGTEIPIEVVMREISDILGISTEEAARSLGRLIQADVLESFPVKGRVWLRASAKAGLLSIPTREFDEVELSKAKTLASIQERRGPRMTKSNIGNYPPLTHPSRGQRQ